jgi:hypothetical protein
VTTDYTPKLIGNIVHDILDQIWRLILETGRSVGDFSKVDEDLIAGVFERVLRIKKKYYYQIPHDFATIYFDQIVKPNINKGISAFFMELADIGLKGRDMEIFPEYTESGEQPYRTLFHSGQNSLGLPVRIRGRADLRIHTPEGKYHIFDYKTGGADEEQLIFYELYYYLIEAPQLLDSVYSHFIHILSRKGDEPTGMSRPDKLSRRKDRLDKFQNDVLSQIETIVFGGFGVPGKKSSQQKWADVMRSDLFVHFGGRKNNC